ncbi:MAG: hypothetical protein IAG13_00165 [Deltaproteobacteria bacterium]|nr:hypothetical protein [Nannocystaceae bacterium]
MKPWRRDPVTSTLEQLLLHVVPGHMPEAGAVASVTVSGQGVELPVSLNGMGRQLLYVGHASEPGHPFESRALLVLRIVLEDGGLRVDLPVELIAPGRSSMVLRVLASPLVLRRRMVRDQSLDEARPAPPRRGTPPSLVA